MITLKRLSVVMSVFGAGLIFAACASPTDAEVAEPSQQEGAVTEDAEDVGAASSALVDEAEEAAEDVAHETEQTAEDVAHEAEQTAEDVTGDDDKGSVSQEQRVGYGHRPGGHGGYWHGRRCDYRDVFHCRRGHRGWRWVDLNRGHDHHHHGRWGHDHRRHRADYCCVRVHVRDHRGPLRGY